MKAARRDKIRIEGFGPTNKVGTAEDALRMSDDAVLRLARLIGRQIAREQFERQRGKKRKPLRHIKNGESS